MKRLKTLIVVIGIMIAMLPAFLYYTQHVFYGIHFSLMTTCITIACFFIVIVLQYFEYKKKHYPTAGPLLTGIGFIVLIIYLLIRFL